MEVKPIKKIIGPLIFLFAVWQIISILLKKEYFPGPLQSFLGMISGIAHEGLLKDTGFSAVRLAAGLAVGSFLGIPSGLLLGRRKQVEGFFGPLLYVLYPLPKIILLPVLVVVCGVGNLPAIVLIAVAAYFQVTAAVRKSAVQISGNSVLMMHSFRATKMQMCRHLYLPSCLPAVFSSLQVCLGGAVTILFFAESFASKRGLGSFIFEFMRLHDYRMMYGGIMMLGILGYICYVLLIILYGSFCGNYQAD